MASASTYVKHKRSQYSNTPSANGGRIVNSVIHSGAKNAVFPDLSPDNTTNGVTRRRKTFLHNIDGSEQVAMNVRILLDHPTETETVYSYICLGDATSYENEVDFNAQTCYGIAKVQNVSGAVDPGSVSFAVDVRNSDLTPGNAHECFRVGDAIMLLDTATIEGISGGNYEQLLICGLSGISGTEFTIELTPTANWAATTAYVIGDVLEPSSGNENGYAYRCTVAGTSGATEPTWTTDIDIADGTVTWEVLGMYSAVQGSYTITDSRVCSLIVQDELTPNGESTGISSAAGTFDGTVDTNNAGTIEQDWTFTFTSSTAYDCSGDTLGAVASGNISSTFEPTNPSSSTPYLSIPASAWGGTFATGDILYVTTNASTCSTWITQVVAAGTVEGNADILGHAYAIEIA